MKKSILGLLVLSAVLSADYTRVDSKEVVVDTATHLMWQDNIETKSTKALDVKGSINFCENLTLGGYDDWRLPNINELFSLVDTTKANPAISDSFKYKYAGNYMSSTIAGTENLSYYYESAGKCPVTTSTFFKPWLIDFSKGNTLVKIGYKVSNGLCYGYSAPTLYSDTVVATRCVRTAQ